jgi:hypothetical protein
MNVSNVTSAPPTSIQSLFAKPKQDLQSLQSALGAGDLAGAQKDFADFKTDISSLLAPAQSTPSSLDQVSTDFKTLQADLNSGDLTDAQKDMSSITQALQGANGHHKHHHHHPAASTDAASNPSDPTTAAATPGNGMDYRAVMAAYAAFNTTGTGAGINATA